MASFAPAFHPWFCVSTMKRKQADSDSASSPPSKRRRCSTLEHGLAGLSIVEPVAVEAVAPEIKMKNSSWYEPEPDRIVVTDLDSSDDEDGGTEALTITPAYLKHIQTRIPRPLAGPPSGGASQAVVLYQPVTRLPRPEPVVVAANDADADADAMDVC